MYIPHRGPLLYLYKYPATPFGVAGYLYTRDMTPVTTTTYTDAAKEVLATVDEQIKDLLLEATALRTAQEEAETQIKLAELRARLFGSTDV